MRSNRREFLRYSSTAAAGFAIAAMSQSALFAATQTLEPLLSVGFTPALPATSVRLGNARSILVSDPTFITRDLRLCIHGGKRADKYQKLRGGVAIDPIYPTSGHDRVFFWSATRNCTTACGALVLPVEATNGASFSVKNLTTNNESILNLGLLTRSDPKLRRGVYIVGVRETLADAVPDWSRFDLVREGNHFVIPNAPVSHAILSVDYAS
jgi:hypothetical protein